MASDPRIHGARGDCERPVQPGVGMAHDAFSLGADMANDAPLDVVGDERTHAPNV